MAETQEIAAEASGDESPRFNEWMTRTGSVVGPTSRDEEGDNSYWARLEGCKKRKQEHAHHSATASDSRAGSDSTLTTWGKNALDAVRISNRLGSLQSSGVPIDYGAPNNASVQL